MKVTAQFYSRLREIVGASSLEMTLPDGAHVQELVEKLQTDYPELRDFERSMLFGIGVEFVDLAHMLKEGDTIALMPPVQGG